jgi:hypothetical protein
MAEPTEQEILADAVSNLEQEIHAEAFTDPPAEAPAETEAEELPPEVAPEAQAPTRDEQGRFAPKKAEAEQPQAPQGEQQQTQEKDDEVSDVPRWRLREIAEERRQAQAERDQLRAELIRLQTAQQRQPQPQQEPQQEIDPLMDPKGFVQAMRAEFQQQLAVEKLNNSLAFSHQRHGERFERAYEALVAEGQRGNRQLVDHLTRQPNPGEAIVRWYGTQEVMRETQGDLSAYEKKVREKLLSDPEFRKQAITTWKNGGSQQQAPAQSDRPNNITRLPPSLSRATGSSANVDPTETDDSDDAVFKYAFNK